MTRRMFWSAALIAASIAAGVVPSYAQGQGGGQGRPGGFGGPGGFGRGGLRGMLRISEVQKELKLEQAQIDLLQALPQPQGFGGRPGGGGGGNFDPAEIQKRIEAARAEQEKQVAEILDAKQMARLKQLELQQLGIRAIERKDVADSLKLTADQSAKVAAAIQAERDGMRQVFSGFQPGQQPSDEERRASFEKMQTLRTGTDAKLNAVLTDAQKKQFQTMQGAPFKFPEFRGFGGNRPPQR